MSRISNLDYLKKSLSGTLTPADVAVRALHV